MLIWGMAEGALTQQDINNIRFLTRSITRGRFPRMTGIFRESRSLGGADGEGRLILGLSGTGELKGGQGVDADPLEIRANRLTFLWDQADGEIVGGNDFLYYRADFLLQEEPSEQTEESLPAEGPWHLGRDLTNPGRVRGLFEFLYGLRELQLHPLEQRLAGSLIHTILGALYEEVKHPWETENLSLRKIREVCRFIDAHPLMRCTVKELADRVNLSPSYLGHLFKEIVGLSPYRYQLQVRMARAARLLSEDRLTVARTAELCGYANPYVFSRVFKEITGKSPGRV